MKADSTISVSLATSLAVTSDHLR